VATHHRFEVALHSEPQAHDTARDPILDGRDSLRLVKLRLGLTLIAVAILPIAAVSPLVRAVAEEARVTHHERMADQAQTVALELEGELDQVRKAASSALKEPAIVAAAAADANAADKRKARDGLAELIDGPTGLIAGATLWTSDGARTSSGVAIDIKSLPSGGVVALPDVANGRILVVTSSEPGDKPARTIITAVSMPVLLAAATPKTELPGRTVKMADPSGMIIAEADTEFDPSAIPGEVLDIATMAAHDSDGRATIGLPGITGWQVVVGAPIPLVALPVQALGALAAMLLLLIGFTMWMARQILRPARALEASRSRLHELYESAREAALRDSLTGLGNHRAFQEAVARMVEGARRYGTEFSLVLIDIDEFKRVNDTKGHAVGDGLLAEVGELISITLRISDAAFRVGGDEFALLLPHTDAAGATILARRLLARGLEDRTNGFYRDPISFSAGVTSCPEFGNTRLELTAQADAALYRGKRNGRTVVTTYDPEKDHGHVDEGMRAELSSAISAVIEAGSLTPVYQPIVELSTGRVVAYEGLVRVPKASTFAHTGAMFDAAEVAGRVADLDRAALDVVLRGAQDLPEWVSLSVNISPRTLEAAEFSATTFLAILRRTAWRPTASPWSSRSVRASATRTGSARPCTASSPRACASPPTTSARATRACGCSASSASTSSRSTCRWSSAAATTRAARCFVRSWRSPRAWAPARPRRASRRRASSGPRVASRSPTARATCSAGPGRNATSPGSTSPPSRFATTSASRSATCPTRRCRAARWPSASRSGRTPTWPRRGRGQPRTVAAAASACRRSPSSRPLASRIRSRPRGPYISPDRPPSRSVSFTFSL